MKYTVTGATGHLGQRVIQDLIQRVDANSVTAAVHTPSKAAALSTAGVNVAAIDYLNIDSMTAAFKGSDVVVYIPSKTYDVLQRITEFEHAISALKAASIPSVIFVSFFADQVNNPFTMSPYYAYAPRRLATSGLRYAVVRNSLYADPLVPYLPELIKRQHLIYPVNDQAMSFITLDDSALAITDLVLTPTFRDAGQLYTLTQDHSLTMPELGRIMTGVTGHQIGYDPVSSEEFGRIYAGEGDGTELASMYRAGALGLFDVVTPDFRRITGQAPEGMKAFLSRNYSDNLGN
ncbi:NAD(P)H-binding protein [Secundilactobacillus folii]|uniref:NAD(P)H-binding protein n=1 Tax=Secundilactobacillus folii TaxID=2678357 RepID=A0A7X3C2R8_9LACO|nr:NAD(P)H-binding protein [Secundilactobacillus folii]MTV81524.1 NAD(P)H-binding protein [Secundilactobacillus folii]